jgi:acyl-CoA thioesterase FadM
MSIDYKIQNKCDHKIYWDTGTLNTDGKRIDITYAIASKAATELKINTVLIDKSNYTIQDYSLSNTIQKSHFVYE